MSVPPAPRLNLKRSSKRNNRTLLRTVQHSDSLGAAEPSLHLPVGERSGGPGPGRAKSRCLNRRGSASRDSLSRFTYFARFFPIVPGDPETRKSASPSPRLPPRSGRDLPFPRVPSRFVASSPRSRVHFLRSQWFGTCENSERRPASGPGGAKDRPIGAPLLRPFSRLRHPAPPDAKSGRKGVLSPGRSQVTWRRTEGRPGSPYSPLRPPDPPPPPERAMAYVHAEDMEHVEPDVQDQVDDGQAVDDLEDSTSRENRNMDFDITFHTQEMGAPRRWTRAQDHAQAAGPRQGAPHGPHRHGGRRERREPHRGRARGAAPDGARPVDIRFRRKKKPTRPKKQKRPRAASRAPGAQGPRRVRAPELALPLRKVRPRHPRARRRHRRHRAARQGREVVRGEPPAQQGVARRHRQRLSTTATSTSPDSRTRCAS